MSLILLLAGEVLIVLLILFMVIGIPLLIGGVVGWVLYRNKLNRAAWQQLAREIQFEMPNPKHLELKGNYNGIETRLAMRVETDRSGETTTTEYFTYCVSCFQKPMRFAMLIENDKSVITKLIGSSSPAVGNQAFDKRFSTVCYDHKIMQRLLLSDFPSNKVGNLMGDLMLASNDFDTVKVNDTHVYVETSGMIRDHAKLKQLLLVTNSVARRFAEAREKFPKADWELKLDQNWAHFAEQNGLRFNSEMHEMEGTYRGFPCKVRIHSAPGVWNTSIILKFPRPLMIGFNIYPEFAIAKAIKIFGFQDIKAGHAEFDAAYIVKAKNEQVAKAKMTQEFCDGMIGLKKNTSQIKLDDNQMEITVTRVLGDQKTLEGYLSAMILTMRRLM